MRASTNPASRILRGAASPASDHSSPAAPMYLPSSISGTNKEVLQPEEVPVHLVMSTSGASLKTLVRAPSPSGSATVTETDEILRASRSKGTSPPGNLVPAGNLQGVVVVLTNTSLSVDAE